jgi:putative transposase
MKKKAVAERGKQEARAPRMSPAMQQLMVPLLLAMEATKSGLLAFVQQMGMAVFAELMATEAAAIVGQKGKHISGRTHHHWGSANTPLPFGGRNVVVPRPRVRKKGGGEIELPSVAACREGDPMPERVAEQVVLGVSTRGYARSLEPADPELTTRGDKKSSASRALIESTTAKLAAFMDAPLHDVRLTGMFLDGIEVAKHAVIIAMGVTLDGTKVPLGLWAGSTENHVVATSLLQSLIARGLHVDSSLLFVIDGGTGLRKALRDVFGDRAVVQRCQVHKVRNVLGYLPDARRPYVRQQMSQAYKSASAKVAKKLLLQLATWLEANGEDSAAASVREGLDETLTVLRLGLRSSLARTFATTNAIENLNGTLRRVLRNVKRWRGESMIRRWVALGIAEAQRGFRRVKGYRQMQVLVAALRSTSTTVAEEKKVA